MKLSDAEWLEFARCRVDPIYFIRNYGWLQHRVLGRIPFDLYRYQEICLKHFLDERFNLILKSRQMGISWLVAAYALWLCLFYTDKKVLMISIKDTTAKTLLKKVVYLYNQLPAFLQVELTEKNTSKLGFCHGSEIESVPTSPDAGRSDSLSLLIVDEAAFVRWIDEIWSSALPTLATGGNAIILSTPNGMGNFYAQLWHGALEGKNLFNPIRLHYYFNPNFTKEWLAQQKANMPLLRFRQEFLGDFIASGNLVFDISDLRALQDEINGITPIETYFTEENETEKLEEVCGLYIYEEPRNTYYRMTVDTAKGGASDFHAAHVIDAITGKQVAEYRTKVPIQIFNQRIFDLGSRYNYAQVAVENIFGTGVTTLLYFIDRNYPNIYYYKNPVKNNAEELGFPTNTLTRPLLINEIDQALREGVTGIQGIRTVNELMNFAWSKAGKAEALAGKDDDLVISYGIDRFIRKYAQLDSGDMPIYYA